MCLYKNHSDLQFTEIVKFYLDVRILCNNIYFETTLKIPMLWILTEKKKNFCTYNLPSLNDLTSKWSLLFSSTG